MAVSSSEHGYLKPHPPRDSRTFPTATCRAMFTFSPIDVLHVPEGRLLLQTVRSHDQYNTTIYGLDDRYRGVRNGRRVVFVNPSDLSALGIPDGSYVDLVSERPGDEDRIAPQFRVIAYPSTQVMTDPASPGMFTRIAVVEPPYIAP